MSGCGFARRLPHPVVAFLLLLGVSALAIAALSASGAPTLIVVSPPGSPYHTSAPSLVLQASVDPPTATVTLNGAPVTANATGIFKQVLSLVEGSNNFTLAATDATNATTNRSFEVILDTVPPEIHIDSPMEASTITNRSALAVIGSTSEPSTVTLNGFLLLVDPYGHFSYDYSLADGVNVLRFSASDRARNIVVVTRTVVFDRYAPFLQVDAPVNGVVTNQTAIRVAGRTETSASIDANGVGATVNPLDGTFSAEGVPLVEGANVIRIEARDPAGNVKLETRTVTLDSQAPTISLNLDADVQTRLDTGIPVNRTRIIVRGTTDDLNATVTVAGRPAELASTSFMADVPLAEGANDVRIVARDAAGNARTFVLHVTRDTIPPIPWFIVPEDIAVVTQAAALDVEGAVGEDAVRVRILFVGPSGPTTEDLDLSAPLAPEGFIHFSAVVPLLEGADPHEVVAYATDAAGNVGTATFTYLLDRTPPTLDVLSVKPGPGGAWVNGTVEVGLGAVFVNGVAYTASDGRFAAWVGLPFALPGNYTLSVVARDAAGNERSENVTARVDLPYSLFDIRLNSGPFRDPAEGERVELSLVGWEAIPPDASVGWSLDGAPIGNGTSVSDFLVPPGTHTVTVTASNGTWSASASRQFTAVAAFGGAAGIAVAAAILAASVGLAAVFLYRRRRAGQ